MLSVMEEICCFFAIGDFTCFFAGELLDGCTGVLGNG